MTEIEDFQIFWCHQGHSLCTFGRTLSRGSVVLGDEPRDLHMLDKPSTIELQPSPYFYGMGSHPSCPGWSWTHYPAQADFELVTFLPQLSDCQNHSAWLPCCLKVNMFLSIFGSQNYIQYYYPIIFTAESLTSPESFNKQEVSSVMSPVLNEDSFIFIGVKEFKQELGGSSRCIGHEGMLLTGLFPLLHSACFLIEPRTTSPGTVPLTVG